MSWRQAGRNDSGARRRYASYDEYVAHQASKLDKIAPRLHEKEDEDFAEFRRRFAMCAALDGARSVLCLGARLGTEVRALHDLGYFAVGIDLNPGERNPYVLPGDFHQIVFPDGAVDAIYTNALDHVFSLERVVGEVARLLSRGGIFIADLELGSEEGFVPGEYEAAMWRDHEALIERIKTLGRFEVAPRDATFVVGAAGVRVVPSRRGTTLDVGRIGHSLVTDLASTTHLARFRKTPPALTTEEADAGADYFTVMRENLRTLRRALGCR